MKAVIIFAIFVSSVFSACESADYLFNYEGNSAGRLSGAESTSFLLEGALSEESVSSASASYEIAGGWYYTVNIDSDAPSAAILFSAVTQANGNIHLNWQSVVDSASPVRGYRIYRAVRQADSGIFLGEVDGTEFIDTAGLIYGITYYYRVVPVDMGNNGVTEGNIVVSALSRSLSTSITSLNTVSKENGVIELSWTPVAGLSYYRIYRSVALGIKGLQVNTDGDSTAGTFSQGTADGLFDGVRYFYTIQGVDGTANEQVQGNNQSSAISDSTAPTVPVISSRTHPDASVSTENCPEFSWVESEDPKAPADGASGIKGYRYLISKNAVESPVTSWPLVEKITLCPGKIEDGVWYLHISAVDNAGNSSAVAAKQFAIKTCGTVSGTLYAEDARTPLQGVKVELQKGGVTIVSTPTGLDGVYSFFSVPFGSYKLKVCRAGYEPYLAGDISISKGAPSAGLNKSVLAVQNVPTGSSAVYPNPCKIATVTFVYSLSFSARAVIEVFNAAGEKVISIEMPQTAAGFQEAKWDAANVPTGVYYYRVKLEGGGTTAILPVKTFSLIR